MPFSYGLFKKGALLMKEAAFIYAHQLKINYDIQFSKLSLFL